VSLHIDGTANALQISRKAEVDMEMVRACLRVLSHHGVIALVDMFFYSNRYECTEKVASLFFENDKSKLLQKAVEFIVKRHTNTPVATTRPSGARPELLSTSPRTRILDQNQSNLMSSSLQMESLREGPLVGRAAARRAISASPNSSNTQEHFVSVTKRDDYDEIRKAVAEFFCALQRMVSIGDLWISLVTRRIPSGTSSAINWKKMFQIFDHRRLATFGQVHGLIRRVHAFPLLVDREGATVSSVPADVYQNKEQDRAARSLGQPKSCLAAEKQRKATSLAASMMDGMTCDDAIVSACEMPFDEILQLFPNSRISTVLSTLDGPRN
jgi:Nitrogen permease regulator 2